MPIALLSRLARRTKSLRVFHALTIGRSLASIALLSSAYAQCLDWRTFGELGPEAHGPINDLLVHDDGSGPALYIAKSSDGVQLQGTVWRWNGSTYTEIGSGMIGAVNTLATFDDGTGRALYAGGLFLLGNNPTSVARWNGTAWQSIAAGQAATVDSMCVFDDGGGPALYAAGSFTNLGGVPANSIAKWNGSTWSALGSGLTLTSSGLSTVGALAVYDSGAGSELYAGGDFTVAGGANILRLARWNGVSWSAVSTGVQNPVRTLASWDDGNGPSLFVGGQFNLGAQLAPILRWNGAILSPLPTGDPFAVNRLAVVDDGNGSRLYVGALVPQFNYSSLVRRWNGATWEYLQSVPQASCTSNINGEAHAFAAYDEGSGPHLFCGGTVGAFGLVSIALVRREANAWTNVLPTFQGIDGMVHALTVHDDGSGPALYAGGAFCRAGDVRAQGVARWDGSAWRSVGPASTGALGTIEALAVHDPGSGPRLYAAGDDTRLWQWDGVHWSSPMSGGGLPFTESIFALQSFNSGTGPELYVGGVFNNTLANNITRWNGSSFNSFGLGVNGGVRALTTYNSGSGNALYAGGDFTQSNAVPIQQIRHIGRWNGTQWSALGSGVDAVVRALATFDDGSGLALYVGGDFTTAGGLPANHVARWDGATWTPVGVGVDGNVYSLGVFDDGSGPKLYAGGSFVTSANGPVNHLACWNGQTWTNLGDGIDGAVFAIASHDDGTGIAASLFVGGDFSHAGTLPSQNFAAWRSCGTNAISKFCFGDGSVAVCPCGNQGLDNRGCENSHLTGGARLNATGAVNPDSIVLHVAGELPHAPTLFFQGTGISMNAVVFGSGLRCVNGSLKRLYTLNASNGSATIPPVGQPSISARSAALGDVLVPGTVRGYQAWYRDPDVTFCQGQFGGAWNLSNAARIVW